MLGCVFQTQYLHSLKCLCTVGVTNSEFIALFYSEFMWLVISKTRVHTKVMEAQQKLNL